LKILEDIRVLDLTQFWFGPFCTLMLADMGAEVIRIEVPWGGVDRIADAALFGGMSYTFHHLNLGKKNLTLNLKTPEGLEVFKELVNSSDVVIQNFRPGTMERLGLGYDELRRLKPSIIYAALSGFGQTGPYRERPSFAPIVEAMSGQSRLNGDELEVGGKPVESAQSYGDLGPGLFAAMAVLAAIRHRDRTGQGQMIDVAQLDCMVSLTPALTGYNLSGMKLWQLNDKYPMGRGFGDLLRTNDGGWVRLASFSPRLIERLKEHLGVDEVTMDQIKLKVAGMTRDEAVRFFVDAEVPIAPVYDLDEVVKDPHLKERGMFKEINHPTAGSYQAVNFPVKFSETPGGIEGPAPMLGEHTAEILREILGYSDDRIKRLVKDGVVSIADGGKLGS